MKTHGDGYFGKWASEEYKFPSCRDSAALKESCGTDGGQRRRVVVHERVLVVEK